MLILNPISLHSVWLLNWGINWIIFFFFLGGKLTCAPNGSWTHNLALYSVIMGGESAKLSYSSLARLSSFTYMIWKISYGCYLHKLEMVLMMFVGWVGFKILIFAYTLVFFDFLPFFDNVIVLTFELNMVCRMTVWPFKFVVHSIVDIKKCAA